MPDRNHQFTLTDDESATLKGIAETDRVFASDVVRLFVRKRANELAPRVPVPAAGGRVIFASDPAKAPTLVTLRPVIRRRNKGGGK